MSLVSDYFPAFLASAARIRASIFSRSSFGSTGFSTNSSTSTKRGWTGSPGKRKAICSRIPVRIKTGISLSFEFFAEFSSDHDPLSPTPHHDIEKQ